ncbi:MAG: glycosyltransferase [Burkholderiales bacterium]|nr:MAG: glycosyltransferase [Burkholderiales bacterium]
MMTSLDIAADARVQDTPAAPVVDVSVVVIGRNEGNRLVRCLASVTAARWGATTYELLYVDSRSSDGSIERAAAMGARAYVLDDAAPCAAKARNLGWRRSRGEFVLFLDGDTELDPDFVGHALIALRDRSLCAAWGHRRESNPGQSLYTRVADLDWVYPTGRTLYFGGDVLVRRAALEGVGGFDPTLNAGEEPELCARLRAAGWQIAHIDVAMTRHDLALTTFRAWWRRAYRSGVAYAEVADRMRRRGDALWQHEAARDFRHGLMFLVAPVVLMASLIWAPLLAATLVAVALAMLARTATRCAWKAPGRTLLHWQYAFFTHVQKIPALFGQLAWRRARRQRSALGLIEYKGPGRSGAGSDARRLIKRGLVRALVPVARLWRRLVLDRWMRVWSLARLQEAIRTPVDPSNVVHGPVEVHGTGNVRFGRNAFIYPGVYLETQGEGRIDIGDDVVLSRGVHIVAFERVSLGNGVMVGEYASLRDANHRADGDNLRTSGHRHAPITVGRNVWIGRGAAVLKGAALGDNCVVAANAAVTRHVAPGVVVGGVPAAVLRTPAAGVADASGRRATVVAIPSH